MNHLFPIFLKLNQFETLLVGGGNVGLEKLEALLVNSPAGKIKLVAPLIKQEIIDIQKHHPSLELCFRNFEFNDLIDKQLVICATDNKKLHEEIYAICKEKRILINVADTPHLCDFYLSSVVRKGDLKIAISTNGKSPTFAKRLKEILNESLTSDNINELLENLGKYRDQLKGDFAHKVVALNNLTKTLIK
jgi:siroheme synthase-like protein